MRARRARWSSKRRHRSSARCARSRQRDRPLHVGRRKPSADRLTARSPCRRSSVSADSRRDSEPDRVREPDVVRRRKSVVAAEELRVGRRATGQPVRGKESLVHVERELAQIAGPARAAVVAGGHDRTEMNRSSKRRRCAPPLRASVQQGIDRQGPHLSCLTVRIVGLRLTVLRQRADRVLEMDRESRAIPFTSALSGARKLCPGIRPPASSGPPQAFLDAQASPTIRDLEWAPWPPSTNTSPSLGLG